MRTVASIVFFLDSLIIGLGAFGHGLQAAHLHSALDQFPIEPNIHSMLFVVWYFVSGCMLTFGVLLLWTWTGLRKGDRRLLGVAMAVGTLYTAIGLFGLAYRHGDPFMGFFVVLGLVLLGSTAVLARPTAAVR